MNPSVSLHKEQLVFVTEVTQDGKFFVQLDTAEAYGLDDLSAQIGQLAETLPVLSSPAVALRCYVRSTAHKQWFRGVIISVRGSSCVVFYVDYGNVETISVTSLRLASEAHFAMPYQAVCCQLVDFLPTDGDWSRAFKALQGLIVERELTLVFRMQDPVLRSAIGLPCYRVAVLDPATKLPITKKLVADGLGQYCISRQNVEVGTSGTAVVSYFDSPDRFWIQLTKFSDVLDELMESLNSPERLDKQEPIPFSALFSGVACCVAYDEDGRFYRGEVTKATASEVTVLYVDYGNSSVVSPSSVLQLSHEFLVLPAQALQCQLEGAEKAKGVTNGWSSSALELFAEQCSSGKEFKAIFGPRVSPGAYKVMLTSDTTSDLASWLVNRTAGNALSDAVEAPRSEASTETSRTSQILAPSPQLVQQPSSQPLAKHTSQPSSKTSSQSSSRPPSQPSSRSSSQPPSGPLSQPPSKLPSQSSLQPPPQSSSQVASRSSSHSSAHQQVVASNGQQQPAHSNIPPAKPAEGLVTSLRQQQQQQQQQPPLSSPPCSGNLQSSSATANQQQGATSSPYVALLKSKYPSLSFKPQDENVYIFHAESPSAAWCQLVSNTEVFMQLMDGIAACYMSAKDKCNIPVPPRAGQPCCLQYREDNSWCRGLVIGFHANKRPVEAEVLYVDYGNVEEVLANELKELLPQFLVLPAQAVCVTLHGVFPKGGGLQWSCEAVERFKALCLKNDNLTCTWVKDGGGDGSQQPSVRLAMQQGDVGEILVKEGLAEYRDEQSFASVAPSLGDAALGPRSEGVPTMVQYPKLLLKKGQREMVAVSHVTSLFNFYCQLLANEEKLGTLVDELQEYADSCSPQGSLTPAVGMPVLAKYSQDGMWYRALTLAQQADGSCSVLFVDYGNAEAVKGADLMLVPPSFLSVPVNAVKCSLVGSYEELPMAAERFAELAKEATFQCTVIESGEESCSVELQHDGQDLLRLLERDGCIKTKASTMPKHSEGDVKGGDAKTGQKPTLLQPVASATSLQCYPAQHQKSLGQALEVTVSHVNSANEFYCQLLSDTENVEALTQEIQNYANSSCPQKVASPAMLTPVLAKYSADNRWYRALIIAFQGKELCTVLFVDYGNTDSVPVKDLVPMPASFLNVQPYAFKCALEGWQDVDANTQLLFPELAFSEALSCTIKGLNPNGSYSVELKAGTKDILCLLKEAGCNKMGKAAAAVAVDSKPQPASVQSVPGRTSQSNGGHESNSQATSQPAAASQSAAAPAKGSVVQEAQLFPSFPVNQWCDVSVSYLESTSRFYVQLVSNTSLLTKVVTELNKASSKAIPNPAIGILCCAQFVEDKLWYRAQITAISGTKGVTVQYLDYGNSDLVDRSSLRVLGQDFTALPPLAIPCQLDDLDVAEPPPKQLVAEFSKLVEGKKVKAMFLSPITSAENPVRVRLHLGKDTSVSHLLKAKFSVESSGSVSMQCVEPPLDTPTECFVPFIEDLNTFYCHLASNNELLQQLTGRLQDFYTYQMKGKSLDHAAVGTLCVALFDDGSSRSWYRARVTRLEPSSASIATVYFVDYGNSADATVGELKVLEADFAALPMQAIACSLQGARPPGGRKQWSDEDITKFDAAVLDVPVTVTFSKSSAPGKYEVRIAEFPHQSCPPKHTPQLSPSPLATPPSSRLSPAPSGVQSVNPSVGSTPSKHSANSVPSKPTLKQSTGQSPVSSTVPSKQPTPVGPSPVPSTVPSKQPTPVGPSPVPSTVPSKQPTPVVQSPAPSTVPSKQPTPVGPSAASSTVPSKQPTPVGPSPAPSTVPSKQPTPVGPSPAPSTVPSKQPTPVGPSPVLSTVPSKQPTPVGPSPVPSTVPSKQPTPVGPSPVFSTVPSKQPTPVGPSPAPSTPSKAPTNPLVQQGYTMITEGSKREVMVVTFHSPDDFYCTTVSSSDLLGQLMQEINHLYVPNVPTLPSTKGLKLGMTVLAQFTDDDVWYRAKVVSIDQSKDSVQVWYVDYGNKEIVPASRLKLMDQRFMLLEPQCIKCQLHNPKGYKWSGSMSSDLFRLITEKELLTAEFVAKKGEVWEVNLFDEDADILQPFVSIATPASVAPPSTTAPPPSKPQVTTPLSVKSEVHSSLPVESQVPDQLPVKFQVPDPLPVKFQVPDPLPLKPQVPSAKLALGSSHAVFLTVLSSPVDFWCQSVNLNEFNALASAISDHCSGTLVPRRDLSTGDYCLVFDVTNEEWCRGKVVSLDPSCKSASVLMVDFGNSQEAAAAEMFALPPEFATLPAQAFHCCIDGGEVTQQLVDLFLSLDLEQEYSVKIIDNKGDGYVVDLLDHKGISITKRMSEACSSHLVAASPAAIPYKQLQYNQGAQLDVYVSYVESPTSFYCQPLELTEDLEAMMADLKAAMVEVQRLDEASVASGLACAAMYSSDGEWYRAVVDQVVDRDQVLVTFVDYGNSEFTSLDNIAALPSQFLSAPVQAIECSILDCSDDHVEWTDEQVDRFASLVQDQEHVTLHLKAALSNDNVVTHVSVFSDNQEIDFSEFFDANRADHEVAAGRTDRSSGDASVELVSGDEPNRSNVSASLPLCLDRIRSKSPSTEGETESEGAEGEPLIKAPFQLNLVVKETTDAKVVFICNPNLIYIQRVDCEDELNALSLEVGEYCTNFAKVQYQKTFTPGDFVLACYAADSMWYRAKVQKVLSDTCMEVFFIDYGNTEEISPVDMVMCPENFLELPVQAIPCSLAHVPNRDSWPADYKSMLSDVVDGRILKLTVEVPSSQGMIPSVTLVDLESGTDISSVVLQQLQQECDTNAAGSNDGAAGVGPSARVASSPAVNTEAAKQAAPQISVPRTLTIGHQYAVSISELSSLGHFSCILVDDPLIADVQGRLSEIYGEADGHGLAVPPCEGDYVCAQFTEDEQWYRAQIEQEEAGGLYSVRYVDFGNGEALPISALRTLDQEFLHLPRCRVDCVLSGVDAVVQAQAEANMDGVHDLIGEEDVTILVDTIDVNGVHGITMTTPSGVVVNTAVSSIQPVALERAGEEQGGTEQQPFSQESLGIAEREVNIPVSEEKVLLPDSAVVVESSGSPDNFLLVKKEDSYPHSTGEDGPSAVGDSFAPNETRSCLEAEGAYLLPASMTSSVPEPLTVQSVEGFGEGQSYATAAVGVTTSATCIPVKLVAVNSMEDFVCVPLSSDHSGEDSPEEMRCMFPLFTERDLNPGFPPSQEAWELSWPSIAEQHFIEITKDKEQFELEVIGPAEEDGFVLVKLLWNAELDIRNAVVTKLLEKGQKTLESLEFEDVVKEAIEGEGFDDVEGSGEEDTGIEEEYGWQCLNSASIGGDENDVKVFGDSEGENIIGTTQECRDNTVETTQECRDNTIETNQECRDNTIENTIETTQECRDNTIENTIETTQECRDNTVETTQECRDNTIGTTQECRDNTIGTTQECRDNTVGTTQECRDNTIGTTQECREHRSEGDEAVISEVGDHEKGGTVEGSTQLGEFVSAQGSVVAGCSADEVTEHCTAGISLCEEAQTTFQATEQEEGSRNTASDASGDVKEENQ